MTRAASALSFVRKALTHNIGLKLMALVVAIVTFSAVRGSEDAQRSVFVDVVAILPAAESGRMLVSELPDQVRVTLEGSRSRINALRPEELRPVEIDLSDTEISHYYFTREEFQIPTGLTVVQLLPASVELSWADRMEVTLPIHALLTGDSPEGLEVHRTPVVRPESVTLIGPVDELEDLAHVTTLPVDISDLGEGRHDRDVPLHRPPPHARYVSDIPIRVSFEVSKNLVERELRGLEVTPLGGVPTSLRPERVEVVLRGSEADLEAIDPARIVPFVQLDGVDLAGGAVSLRVEVRGVPESLDLVRVDPPELLVR